MLRHEVLEEMTTEEWIKFKKLAVESTKLLQLPDGRMVSWYDDNHIHDFLVQERQINGEAN